MPDPLPRLRLLSRTQVCEDPARDIQRIDLATTALVTHPVEVADGEPGTADLTADSPGELCLRVAAPGRRLLVIADSYDPNWRLFVDDKPATVERVNGDFLGCVVEAGEHDVHFIFRPASIRYGRLLSLTGLVITLLSAGGCCLAMLSRSRRAAGGPGPVRPCG